MQKQSSREQKTIYLHIGLHKTGTSFLQREIFPKMKEIDFRYHRKYIYDISVCSDKTKILFSDENYSVSMPHYRHMYECEDALLNFKKLFPDAKIIIGTRNKDKWLYSCYCQFVKGNGGYISYTEYLKKYEKDILDFDEYVAEVKSLWSDVFVYDFSEFRKDSHKVIKSMCDFMGCSVPTYENNKVNVKLNKNQILLLRTMNRIVSLNGRVPGNKILLFFLRLIKVVVWVKR